MKTVATMEAKGGNTNRVSCSCTTITCSLSSFTAAEFGDVQALLQAFSREGSNCRRSSSWSTTPGILSDGITPLHLAAQHGNVAATWILLEKGYPVDGDGPCTPLHRASFSGATATMSLLLDSNQKANLLAVDKSFGDERTPLHKAVAGGRYLAVALLIDAVRKEGLLEEALKARDRNNETPIEVAHKLQKNQLEERQSVARWNVVAGGIVADWGKCVALLSKAEQEVKSIAQVAPAKKLPSHPFGSLGDCFECEANGKCVTASWSTAFQKALRQAVSISQISQEPNGTVQSTSLKQDDAAPRRPHADAPAKQSKEQNLFQEEGREIDSARQAAATRDELRTVSPQPKESHPIGRACKLCRVNRFVLFTIPSGALVCKECKQRRRGKKG